MVCNNNRGDMKKWLILLVLVIFSVLIIPNSSAVTIDPSAVFSSMSQQVTGITDWYRVDSYTVDESGRQVPVLNSQYEFGRRVVDFFFIFIILFGLFNKSEALKERFKRGPRAGLAAILAFSFAASSKVGFLAGLFPFVSMFPYLFVVAVIYLGIVYFMGEKASPTSKVFVFLAAVALTYLIFSQFLISIPQLSIGSKIPFMSSGWAEPKYAEHLVSTEGYTKAGYYDIANRHYEQAIKFRDQKDLDGVYAALSEVQEGRKAIAAANALPGPEEKKTWGETMKGWFGVKTITENLNELSGKLDALEQELSELKITRIPTSKSGAEPAVSTQKAAAAPAAPITSAKIWRYILIFSALVLAVALFFWIKSGAMFDRFKLAKEKTASGLIPYFKKLFTRQKKKTLKFEELMKEIAGVKKRAIENMTMTDKIKYKDYAVLRSETKEIKKTLESDLKGLDRYYNKIEGLANSTILLDLRGVRILGKAEENLKEEIAITIKNSTKEIFPEEILKQYKMLETLSEEELKKLHDLVKTLRDLHSALNNFKEEVLDKQLKLIGEERAALKTLVSQLKKRKLIPDVITESIKKISACAEEIYKIIDELEKKVPLYDQIKSIEKDWIKKGDELFYAERRREEEEAKQAAQGKKSWFSRKKNPESA